MNRYERHPRFWRPERERDERSYPDRSGSRSEWRGDQWSQGEDSRDRWREREWSSQPYGQREPYNARGNWGSGRGPWGGGPSRDDNSRYSESQYGVGRRRNRFDAYGAGAEPEFGEGPFADRSEAPGYFGSGNYADGGAAPTGGFDQRTRERYPGSLGEDTLRSSGRPREERRYRTGPKGYTRSDERIREDISERLMLADSIDSSEVTVSVKEGRVTLEGTVPTRSMKHAIEDLADYTAGVQDVDNRIRVERPGSSPIASTAAVSAKTTRQ